MTTREKVKFLQYEFIQQLRTIDADKKPNWGKMNMHQMIEHMSNSVQIAIGKIPVVAVNKDEEAIEKSYRFMMSDKPFAENTPNPLMPDTPPAPTTASIGDAIDNLEDDLQDFVDFYKEDHSKKVLNAFFGELDYYEQAQLLFKHAQHHLKQFS